MSSASLGGSPRLSEDGSIGKRSQDGVGGWLLEKFGGRRKDRKHGSR